MYNETDPANPQGMQRPKIKASKKVYQDDPMKTRRTLIPVNSKSQADALPDKGVRPMIAWGEGNNPQGMPRPQKQGAPYDQDLDLDY